MGVSCGCCAAEDWSFSPQLPGGESNGRGHYKERKRRQKRSGKCGGELIHGISSNSSSVSIFYIQTQNRLKL